MLAAAASTEPTDGKTRKAPAYDTFDSPFHTPALFSCAQDTSSMRKHYDYSAISADVGMIADLASSGTPSPKEELYDPVFRLETTAKFQYPRLPFDHDPHRGTPSMSLPTTTSLLLPSIDVSFKEIDKMPAEALRRRLKEAAETIQGHSRHMQSLCTEVDRSRHAILSLQSSLSSKEAEIQDLNQRLIAATRMYDAQAVKLTGGQIDFSMYQSMAKSGGVMNKRDASAMEQRLSLLARENSELKTKQRRLTQELESERMRAELKERDILQLRGDLYVAERRASAPSPLLEKVGSTTSSEHTIEPLFKSSRRWSDERTGTPQPFSSMDKRYSLATTEYRRMLDKSVNANWEALVDRIIHDTDQQASIFLQQKLKCATADQKESIFKAILKQAYVLMTNRFGNFLVQRLLELGTPLQVKALADTMVGRVLDLMCEPFGCHVIQKALDYVDEDAKTHLVEEMFERIPETIVHKYACHVWQKIFEIRWHGSPPAVMARVHEALQGQWAQVALDETGSLAIQNIFENLTEPEKRPVLDEVLDNIATIAKGQWGNWVIQHILEQAEKRSDRERAFQVVLDEAVQLSMDQFASKVVEKALRIGGPQFLVSFIDRISITNRSHRPRMALIDIASDQYGNYVIQWLINNANEDQKVAVCRSVKRHMVSLRGSKYGQRVAFLVDKVMRHHEITTFPSHTVS